MFPPLRARLAFAATALLLLTSCGAGIVGAVVGADDGSNNDPAARNPTLTVPDPVGPLAPSALIFRRVILNDVVLPPAATVTVELSAEIPDPMGPGLITVTQSHATVILSDPSQTPVVGFALQTGNITVDPTAGDVDALLAVLANGVEVAPPVPFTLLRQPTATLIPRSPGANVFLSPLGGGLPLQLRVSGLRAGAEVDELEMLLVVRDRVNPIDPVTLDPRFILLSCTNLALDPIPASSDYLLSGSAPSNSFPGEVGTVVRDNGLGTTTPFVLGVYYGPDVRDVSSTSPGAGPTDGGTVVSLLGTAMVPLNVNVTPGEPAVPDFDLVSIRFRKGDRSVTLRASDLRRDESSLDRLVFPIPPSPDGLPGLVSVVVQVTLLGQQDPQFPEDGGVFFYGDTALNFGPRGTILNQSPIAMELARFSRMGTEAPDAVLLTDLGGVPRVQLYSAAENGMFNRFGLPLQAGNIAQAAERAPVDLIAGDFDTGTAEDLIVINRGEGTTADHNLVEARASLPPLQAMGPALSGNAQSVVAVAGDLDGDMQDDLVLLPGSQAASGAPEVYLARPTGTTNPNFNDPFDPLLGDGPFEAAEVVDVDGDDRRDLILAGGGLFPQVVIAYGVDGNQFEDVQRIDLAQAVPGYTPDPLSGVVGVHVCGEGSPRSIAVVFAGVPGSGTSEPTVAVLAPAGTRTHAPPDASGVLVLGGADTPLGHSVTHDLDGIAGPELILGASGDSVEPLRLLVWGGQGFSQNPDGVSDYLERPIHITGMKVDELVPGPTGPEELGLFVSHRALVDGIEEQRLSTWVVANGPVLLSPDASSALDLPIRGMVSGDFSEDTSLRDLALASLGGVAGGEILILETDDLGRMTERNRIPASGLLPETLTRLTLDPGLFPSDLHGLTYLCADATLGVMLPDGIRMREVTHDLGPVLPAHLQGLPVSEASSMVAADVDGDGSEDLVVLLRFKGLVDPGEDDGALVVLRGQAADQPLLDPVSSAPVHGLSSCFAVGNMIFESGMPRLLEMAVAVPRGSSADPLSGNHVRFFRYDPSVIGFVRSFASSRASLFSGSEPSQLCVWDFSGNGVDDLLVASGGDQHMRLFVNSGIHDQEINIDSFTPVATPNVLPPGEPGQMILSDLNGDRVIDVLVATRQQGPALEHSVAYYLRNALGSLDGPFLLPMTRTGNHVQMGAVRVPRNAKMVLHATDFNGDGRVDLAFGWDSAGTGDRNLRVLFGGSR